jgi:hypothetical protein
MKRFVVFLVAILMAVAMLAASPATAGPKHGVPFKGNVQYTVTSITVLPDGSVLETAVGTGNLTHMGRITAEVSGVGHADGTVSGTVVYTAANGDQVFLTVEGAFTSPTTTAGTFTITGGTGRFTNATGGGDFVDVFSADLSHFTTTVEGSIKY